MAPSTAVEYAVEEKHKEVMRYIQELKDTALQMSKICPYSNHHLFLSDGSDGAPIDVNQPDDDSTCRNSLKRRRIFKNRDGRSSDSAQSTSSQEELDRFLERLAYMEGLIFILQVISMSMAEK